MKKDIILCGVGGQGILSIATVIGEAATAAGLQLKQAEVHGMSQRGGDVQSHLRLSDSEILSDLIPVGEADMIISMEPMEALRYVQHLSKDGVIVTSSTPFVNIPDYPAEQDVLAELDAFPNVVRKPLEGRTANMQLLGLAAPYIGILSREQLRDAVAKVFAHKGEDIVKMNLECI